MCMGMCLFLSFLTHFSGPPRGGHLMYFAVRGCAAPGGHFLSTFSIQGVEEIRKCPYRGSKNLGKSGKRVTIWRQFPCKGWHFEDNFHARGAKIQKISKKSPKRRLFETNFHARGGHFWAKFSMQGVGGKIPQPHIPIIYNLSAPPGHDFMLSWWFHPWIKNEFVFKLFWLFKYG